jgi:SAM-dependent methyltransferase
LDTLLVRRPDIERIHNYWIRPDDGANNPKDYVTGRLPRSEFLLARLAKLAEKSARVLEIGCNAGRNLHCLEAAGFSNLSAIEISADALATMEATYPGLRTRAAIMHGAVETFIKDIPDKSFDVVYTMAVLEHIHKDSEWVFAEMVRIAKTLVIIEDEWTVSWRHFPRNYRRVFERFGARQIDYAAEVPGLPGSYRYRAFDAGR